MRKSTTTKPKGKKSRPETKLGIPDLEHSNAAVLRSLGSPDSVRGYQHAIDEFVAWYCSEPRWAFNKTVVFTISLSPGGARPRARDYQRANGCRGEKANDFTAMWLTWLKLGPVSGDATYRTLAQRNFPA